MRSFRVPIRCDLPIIHNVLALFLSLLQLCTDSIFLMANINTARLDGRYSVRRWFIQRCSEVVEVRRVPVHPNDSWTRGIKSWFGVSLEVMVDLNHELSLTRADRSYLLWALNFLKCYETEDVARKNWHVTAKTYRKHVLNMIERIAELDLIKFENRWIDWEHKVPSMSIDGTDFFIQEQRPICKGDYSHKFRHAGLRYEIGVALGSSNIVHIAGGYPAGSWPDIKIARECLVPLLTEGEQAAADNGYQDGDQYFLTPFGNPGNAAEREFNRQLKSDIMARHETINKRFEHFKCLATRQFRHSRGHHITFFTAVAMLVQLTLKYEPLYDLKSRLT